MSTIKPRSRRRRLAHAAAIVASALCAGVCQADGEPEQGTQTHRPWHPYLEPAPQLTEMEASEPSEDLILQHTRRVARILFPELAEGTMPTTDFGVIAWAWQGEVVLFRESEGGTLVEKREMKRQWHLPERHEVRRDTGHRDRIEATPPRYRHRFRLRDPARVGERASSSPGQRGDDGRGHLLLHRRRIADVDQVFRPTVRAEHRVIERAEGSPPSGVAEEVCAVRYDHNGLFHERRAALGRPALGCLRSDTGMTTFARRIGARDRIAAARLLLPLIAFPGLSRSELATTPPERRGLAPGKTMKRLSPEREVERRTGRRLYFCHARQP